LQSIKRYQLQQENDIADKAVVVSDEKKSKSNKHNLFVGENKISNLGINRVATVKHLITGGKLKTDSDPIDFLDAFHRT
jgi:hypothetical protein